MRKDAPIISCFHLALSASESVSRKLIDDITLEVQAGSWNEFVGCGGAGKSLLFGILSLRFEPDDGKLVIDGRNFDRLSRRGIADLRRRFASCGQTPILLERRTVLENLVLPFVVRREEQRAVSVCEELLAEAELERLRDMTVSSLSHQERLVVGALRAIAGEPHVILVDGILEQLEDDWRRLIMRLLQARHLNGATILVFGRQTTQNARRGTIFRLADGVLTDVDHSVQHERVPEATGVRV